MKKSSAKNNGTGGSSMETEWCKNFIQLYLSAPKMPDLEFWAVMCGVHGTVDCKVQDKQKVYIATIYMLLNVVSKGRRKRGWYYDLKKPMIFKKMQCTLLLKLTIHCIS